MMKSQPVFFMCSLAPNDSWLAQLRLRFAAHWLIKALAIPAFMSGFFVAYFHLLQHPRFPVTMVPLRSLDRLIGFHPEAMLPYASLWVYVLLAPAFLRGRREIFVYCTAATALALVGLGLFLLWPTAVPPPGIDWAAHPSFVFLKGIDASGNACPSLHVAFALFTAVWLDRLLRQIGAPQGLRALNALWSTAIVFSTLATKQHVTVDLVAGVALGAIAGVFDPLKTTPLPARNYSIWNRQLVALAVCFAGKLAIVAFDLWLSHPAMALLLFFGPDLWILTGLLVPNASGLIPTATRFVTPRREIWLTIDDGPDPDTTPSMLALLQRHAAKATFFLIGEKAAAHPALVAEILRHGHTLGNHTHTHPLATFWLAGQRRTAAEIDGCQAALSQSGGGMATGWFRSPAGIKTFFLRRILAERNLVLVGWSARGRETFSASIERPLRRLQRALRPGAILLVHERSAHGAVPAALLAALLDRLSTAGYRCVLPDRADLR